MSTNSRKRKIPAMLTVAELKKALEKFPDDMELITSIDEEGNGYNAVFGGPSVIYIEAKHAHRSRWDGDQVLRLDELKDLTEDELACQYKKMLLID